MDLALICTLIFLSDVQLNDRSAGPDSVAALLSAQIGTASVFDAGDVSEHALGTEYDRYRVLFPYAQPVPGNHDWYHIEAWPWSHSFDQYLDGIHVVGFDTAYRFQSVEMAALAATLDDGPIPTILYMHWPIYSANLRVGGVAEANLALFLPMIEAAGVRLVIGGHGHAYERHLSGGLTAIVVGTGGAPLDQVGTSPTLIRSVSRHGWLEIDRVGVDLVGRFRGVDGAELDGFTVPGESPVGVDLGTWGGVKCLYR